MDDYISREAALEQCKRHGDYTAWSIEDGIEAIPAADVEPVRYGRWEGYTHSRYCGIDEYHEPIYREGTVYYCSNPKCRRKTVVKENYCPSCGRKMDLNETDLVDEKVDITHWMPPAPPEEGATIDG